MKRLIGHTPRRQRKGKTVTTLSGRVKSRNRQVGQNINVRVRGGK